MKVLDTTEHLKMVKMGNFVMCILPQLEGREREREKRRGIRAWTKVVMMDLEKNLEWCLRSGLGRWQCHQLRWETQKEEEGSVEISLAFTHEIWSAWRSYIEDTGQMVIQLIYHGDPGCVKEEREGKLGGGGEKT